MIALNLRNEFIFPPIKLGYKDTTGMKSFNPLEKELKNNILVHVIGDAKKTGNAQDAIHNGYKLAMSL